MHKAPSPCPACKRLRKCCWPPHLFSPTVPSCPWSVGRSWARWAGSTHLLLLPSSSAMNCTSTCLPSKSPCCVSGGTKEHQLQPSMAVCQEGAVLPMAWDHRRLEPIAAPRCTWKGPMEVSWPNPLPQAWLWDPGSHMSECICVGSGASPVPCPWTYLGT